MMKRRAMAVAVMLVGAAALSGCGDSDDDVGVATVTSTLVVTPSTAASSAAGSSANADCVEDGMDPATWNTAADTAPPLAPVTDGGVTDVTPSAGDCFDTIVIRTDTDSDVGFNVRYVPQVTEDGSGRPVPLRGDAFLQVSVSAPLDPQLTDTFDFTADDQYRTLREIAFATSFEGVTTLGVGVDHTTPFAVESRRADDGTTDIVMYLAH